MVYGRLGAEQYHFKVTVEASKFGIENNVVGEITFFVTLKYKYGDLNTFNNKELDSEIRALTYDKFKDETSARINEIGAGNSECVFDLANYDNQIIVASDFYDSATNEKLTEEIFNSLPNFTRKTFYTFIHPTKNGKKLGVFNSTKVFVNFFKD